MPSTPKHLVEALDFITADQPPGAAVESLHAIQVNRVRGAFDDPNIVGVGISRKVTDGKELEDLCVCFYVIEKEAVRKIAPKYLVPSVIATDSGKAAYTDVKAIGRIVPEINPLAKPKPIESGFSVGHIKVTAGTVGAVVKKGDKRFLLSNSHVLANSGKGNPGDKWRIYRSSCCRLSAALDAWGRGAAELSKRIRNRRVPRLRDHWMNVMI